MECPKCKYSWKLPGPQKGGQAKVKKGFAVSSAARIKAQDTQRRNRKAVNAPAQGREAYPGTGCSAGGRI
jgi:hypothetical protein